MNQEESDRELKPFTKFPQAKKQVGETGWCSPSAARGRLSPKDLIPGDPGEKRSQIPAGNGTRDRWGLKQGLNWKLAGKAIYTSTSQPYAYTERAQDNQIIRKDSEKLNTGLLEWKVQ